MNYQIMGKDHKGKDGRYYPNYEELIKNAESAEEINYIKKVKELGVGFIFNMVYITRQQCGHYEIFQIPVNDYTLAGRIEDGKAWAAKRNCTACICNWQGRGGNNHGK